MVFGEGDAPSPFGSEPNELLLFEPKVVSSVRVALTTMPIGAARSNLLSYEDEMVPPTGAAPALHPE